MKIPAPTFFALSLLASAATAGPSTPKLQAIGAFRLPANAPEGLSGLTWMGGDTFMAAEDSGGRLHTLKLFFEKASGAITICSFTGTRTVKELEDAEGIAYDEASKSLFVSDESGPKILKLSSAADDASFSTIPLPEVLKESRPNKSLEALSFGTDASGKAVLWTANEDALACDGPGSSTNTAAIVRLFAIDPAGEPSATREWRYQLDKAEGTGLSFGSRSVFTPFNGLAALAALGDGKLLALERLCGQRQVTDGPSDATQTTLITIRLYFVDTTRAEPNSGAVLPKTLLATLHSGCANYEGMALGPTLPDGSRLLILVADGDTTTVSMKGMSFDFPWEKTLFSLKLHQPPAAGRP